MQLLTETYLTYFTIQESSETTGNGGKVLKGIFGKVDEPTANGRLYPRDVVQSSLNKVSKLMKNRGWFGELDHPDSASIKFERVSHLITECYIDKDGYIRGTIEVLPTQRGKDLEALANSNVMVGVSMRGRGELVDEGNGTQRVKDYILTTFDVVVNPAVADARVTQENVVSIPEKVLHIKENTNERRKNMGVFTFKDLDMSTIAEEDESLDINEFDESEKFEKQVDGLLSSLIRKIKEAEDVDTEGDFEEDFDFEKDELEEGKIDALVKKLIAKLKKAKEEDELEDADFEEDWDFEEDDELEEADLKAMAKKLIAKLKKAGKKVKVDMEDIDFEEDEDIEDEDINESEVAVALNFEFVKSLIGSIIEELSEYPTSLQIEVLSKISEAEDIESFLEEIESFKKIVTPEMVEDIELGTFLGGVEFGLLHKGDAEELLKRFDVEEASKDTKNVKEHKRLKSVVDYKKQDLAEGLEFLTKIYGEFK